MYSTTHCGSCIVVTTANDSTSKRHGIAIAIAIAMAIVLTMPF
jgi:hypothetical protein